MADRYDYEDESEAQPHDLCDAEISRLKAEIARLTDARDAALAECFRLKNPGLFAKQKDLDETVVF